MVKKADVAALALESHAHMDTSKWGAWLDDAAKTKVKLEVLDEKAARTEFHYQYTRLQMSLAGTW